MNELDKNIYSDEIDVKDIINELFAFKKTIISFTSLAAICSVIYALYLPNIYTSSALLSVANEKNQLSSKLGSFSTLAGIAGVSLPTDTNNPSAEAVARMKSFDFFSTYFLPNITLEDLYASNGWDSEKNIILYDSKLFDKSKNKWTNGPAPSNQEAYEIYKEIFSVSEDAKTGFVTVSIKSFSPHKAKEWLEIVIYNINESMRDENIKTASNSIEFLNNQMQTTNLKELKDGLSQLMQSQMQNLMLASVSDSYIYKVINSPIAPEKKSAPGRAFISIFGTFLGLVLSSLFALFRYYRIKGNA